MPTNKYILFHYHEHERILNCHIRHKNVCPMKQRALTFRHGFIKAKDLPETNGEIACLHTYVLAWYTHRV